MKSFIVIAFVCIMAGTKASYVPPQPPQPAYGPPPPPAYGPPAPVSYGAPSPSIPCPKNIVVSCAPSVQAIPCKNAPAYGPTLGSVHTGAYTENAPQYVQSNQAMATGEEWLSAPSQFANQYAAQQQQYAPYSPYAPYH